MKTQNKNIATVQHIVVTFSNDAPFT